MVLGREGHGWKDSVRLCGKSLSEEVKARV